MKLPYVEGIISAPELKLTAETIAEWQLPSGMIPWFPGGHADPWNHIEAVMALATAGLLDEAAKGYQWLADNQRDDGSWHNYYIADEIEDPKLDVNCVAYIATGIWHHYLTTNDAGFLEAYWPIVSNAMSFVLDMQTERGEVVWARHVDRREWDFALLTGSSSIRHSLGSAINIALEMNEAPDGPLVKKWSDAKARLTDVIVNQPEVFEPKERWAMDWYYPVLAGAVTGDAAQHMLKAKADLFIMDGKGVRCVSDQPWVTAAETCECVMAYEAAGLHTEALDLFKSAQTLRHENGSYYTGLVYPDKIHYPEAERSTYTAAAVVLAADCLYGENPTSKLFLSESH